MATFWLQVFEAKIEGRPSCIRARGLQSRGSLDFDDRACLGDRADAYSLGEIELGQRATMSPRKLNLSAGSDDSSQPEHAAHCYCEDY